VRALITGAGGFCGRHLARYLEGQGVEVHTVGARETSAHHHVADPFDSRALSRAIVDAEPAYLFHLAGTSSGKDGAVYYAVNTLYAARLFGALEQAQVACPVLLVGTSAEYGSVEPEELPIGEDAVPRPYSHYGVSKLAQTQMGLIAGRSRPVVVVRPFNIIGTGMPNHNAVQSFACEIADIIRGRRDPVVHVGNLDVSRDFVAVEDVVETYWRLVQSPSAYGRIVNVCTGIETNMRALLTRLIDLSGMSIEVRVDPARVKPIDIARHCGSVARLRSILGSSPASLPAPILERILETLVEAP
jgi:GDP-4-dehydro-6-deoxy-D-mannose reductase